jgi:hypothetical protein
MSSMALATPAPAGVAANTQEDWAGIERVFRGMVARETTGAQIDAAIMVCKSLGFNPILQHINLIDGKVYVTHKGLWHLAHRSGMLDGIEVLAEDETQTHWTARVAIYRKDMRYPFAFTGRYPKGGRNKQYGPEMALARAECLALRRAFDVSMPVYEEINWEEREGERTRPPADIREVPRPAPAALPAPAEVAPAVPAFDFAAWSRYLDVQAGRGVATSELAAQINRLRDDLSDAEYEAVMLWFRQVKATRKAARATDEALLARVVDAGRSEQERADAASYFLDKATDAERLFERVAQLTVLDFPAPIIDVLVEEQRKRLGLPDDDEGEVAETPARPTWVGDDEVPF